MAVTLEQFIQQLSESGLMSAPDVQSFLDSLPGDQRPADREDLARRLVASRWLTTYQAECLDRGEPVVLGTYIVLDKLGQGGMGMVLRAEHRRMKRVVALKVLSPKITHTPDALHRFQREVEVAARLVHPHIVHAYDANEDQGVHFLVMEYVDGTDLASLVKKSGPLPIDAALHCVMQAARGLEYAHQQGVVHRDVKPANLLLDRGGTIKILDLGLARLEAIGPPTDDLTDVGQIMGTVDYMAPEQAVDTRQADARSDIYSLGMTLWFLLTGRPAYAGETPLAKIIAHREQPIPDLQQARPDVSARLQSTFADMVAKQADRRFPHMTAVLAALDDCWRSTFTHPSPLADSLPEAQRSDSTWRDFVSGTAAIPAGSTRLQVAPSAEAPAGEHTLDVSSAACPVDTATVISPARSSTSSAQRLGSLPWYRRPRRRLAAEVLAGSALGLGLWFAAVALTPHEDPRLPARSTNPPTTSSIPNPTATDSNHGTAIASAGLPPQPADGLSAVDVLTSPEWKWSPLENLGNTINSPRNDSHPCLTADGLQIVFSSNRRFQVEIFEAKRDRLDAPFGVPVAIQVIDGARQWAAPVLSADGLTLTFSSTQPQGRGKFPPSGQMDLYITRRARRDAVWESPENLGPPINSPSQEHQATISPDGLAIVFSSMRPGGFGDLDLWISRRPTPDAPWGPPRNLGPNVNSPLEDDHAYFLDDGRSLVCLRKEPNALASLWLLRPAENDAWTATRLDIPLLSAECTYLTPNARTLYAAIRHPNNLGDFDLWMTSRVPLKIPSPPNATGDNP